MVADRYRVERLLGQGAMGAVFEVTTSDGNRFALKSLFKAGGRIGKGEHARFLREASITGKLTGENIARVHDHGFDPQTGNPFLVMDLLQGEDLEAAIARVGPLEPAIASAIVLQVCRALEGAHAAGIVHRDIKPPNIFLHAVGDSITVKTCDFGIAKLLDYGESLTATGSVLGSPLYMAPEQFRDSKGVDERSDVWSVAMTLYHALAGRPAMAAAQTFPELVMLVTRGDIPPLQSVAPWVESDLAAVVHGALLVDRNARCPSVRQFAMALESASHPPMPIPRAAIAPMDPARRSRITERTVVPTSWADVSPPISSTIEHTDPLIGQTLSGRYRLQRVLGRGGMGAVYQAESSNGESFAVKVIRPDLGEHRGREAIRRFVREAKASQDIDSPYIARIVDAGADEERGLPYLAMELLRGRDLGALIRELGPLEPDTIVPLFVQALAGLSAAHARGVVHRDIKPANIFLHETPSGDVVAKLCDFGVAKQIVQVDESTELTKTGGVLGSPMYMSPEQAQNAKNVDLRSDIWSIGISMYEALTGTKAWEGSTMGELILAICTRTLQPMLEVAPWVRPEIAAAVHRATERDPAKRFASADEMAAALRPLVSRTTVGTGALRGVSPERRRAAIAARSSQQLPYTGDSSGTGQPNSAVSIAQAPARTRGSLVAIVAVTAVLGAAGGAVLFARGSGVPATGPSVPPQAAVLPTTAPTSSEPVMLAPPPESAAPEPPAASSPPVVASSAPAPPVAAAKPVGAGGKTRAAAPKPSASSAPAAPTAPAAPSFKTTW